MSILTDTCPTCGEEIPRGFMCAGCTITALMRCDDDEDPPKCEDCDGEGYVLLFMTRVRCDTCGGSGY